MEENIRQAIQNGLLEAELTALNIPHEKYSDSPLPNDGKLHTATEDE